MGDVVPPPNEIRKAAFEFQREDELFRFLREMHALRNILVKIEYMPRSNRFMVVVHYAVMDITAQLMNASAVIGHAAQESQGKECSPPVSS
jgi:hypothetical protein